MIGVTGSPFRFSIALTIAVGSTWSTFASARSSARWAGHVFGRFAGHSWMDVPATLSTSTFPLRSRMRPRGASSRSRRTWLFCASCRYELPESTCSAHSRRNRIAKIARASAPRIAMRSAICGVSRYGSVTRGSGGRKRREPSRWALLAKEPHLADAVGQLGRREEPAAERVDRHRQEEVERQLGRERVDEHRAGWRRLAEEEVQRQASERVQDRHDPDGQERRVRAVARGRLAVAPDPEAAHREQQGREPERAE